MATTDPRKRVTAVAPLVLALLSLSTSALQADQGGTRAGAETLSLPSEVDAALTTRDRDYFRIDLTAPGRLDIVENPVLPRVRGDRPVIAQAFSVMANVPPRTRG